MVAYKASANLLEIIRADDIIYGSEFEQLLDDIVIHRDYLFGLFIPSYMNKVLLRNMEVPDFFEEDLNLRKIAKSNFKIDYNNTIRTVEFDNEVYNNSLKYMYAINSYRVFNHYLSETLKLIELNTDD
jgi:hypothetical protein